MNEPEYLLTCVSEEAGEITQCIGKIQRFGFEDSELSPHKETNRTRLVNEVNDILAIMTMLAERGLIPPDWVNLDKQKNKIYKVENLMGYSIKCGTLQK